MISICLAMIDTQEEKDEFEEVVHKYQDRLFALAFKILKNNTLAEEALWDTWLNVANCFQKVNNLPMYKMEAYLIITLRRACYSIYNKEKKHFNDADIENCKELADTDYLEGYEKADIAKALSKLDEKYKTVIAYFYYYGLSAGEIAREMNISRSAVYKYRNQAIKILRKELGDDYYEE